MMAIERAVAAETPPGHTPTSRRTHADAMSTSITLKLYATLQAFLPPSGEIVPIAPGMTVQELLAQLNLPLEKAKLIFIDGLKADTLSRLNGGERVGIFPPVGGG
jgi:sulfur carrier protein ThiS